MWSLAIGLALYWTVSVAAYAGSGAVKQQVIREDIEWTDSWLPHTNDRALPHVLLIGDSIAKGYGPLVETALSGIAYVGRFSTSKSLGDPAYIAEVSLVLQTHPFDIIHINNGLHGRGYSEAEYIAALPGLLQAFHRYAPKARVIWASTTDVRVPKELSRDEMETNRVIGRNLRVKALVERLGIPIDDLFEAVHDHPEFHVTDGVHFSDAGYAALAEQVEKSIRAVLPSRP